MRGDNLLFNPIEQVFINNNLPPEDINWYLNPTPFEHDGSLIKNMEEGVDLLLSHIQKDNHIHVQIDLDLDGMTSSSILINYLKRVYPEINITWTNHVKMKHGIDLDLVPETTSLLIVPDAGSNNFEEHRLLKEKGIDVLIIDHHEASHYSEDALVINIQLDDYPNKQISGAGVCFKLIQQLDKKLGLNYSKDYMDLLAFGLLGDSMQISPKETYWYVKKGLSSIKNEFLREIVKENVEDGVELSPKTVAFKCNPKINSLIRVGTHEELDDLMLAFLEHQEITINNRLRSTDKSETWCRKMARTANNTYARQRRLRDKIMEEIEAKIEQDKLYENHFITVEVEGEYDTNMSGYVAIQIVNKYRKPSMILRRNKEGILTGSLRGYDPLMKDTKEFLNSLSLFTTAQGHPQACGLEIDSANFSLLDEAINHRLQDVEMEELYDVDFEMSVKGMTPSLIEDMDRYSSIWGKGIEEPVYAVTSIEVNGTDLQLIGKAQNVLKFSKSGVEYVQFAISDELREMVGINKVLTIDVVGTTSINQWLGNKTPQFVITKADVRSIDEPNFGFMF